MTAPEGDGAVVSAGHELLLQAALWSGDRAADAFARWRATVDLDAIDQPSHRLLPLIAPRLPDLAPDDPLRRVIQGVYRHAWAMNHRLWREALPVLRGLRERGVDTLLLKGAALLEAYGGHWGARPMYDVDLLVREARVHESLDLLTALGWEPEQGVSVAWVRRRAVPNHHSWGFVRGEGRLDLHWHVLPDSIGAHADTQFWSHARPLLVEGSEERVLDPAHLLTHVLLHGNTAMNRPVLQWIADATTVMRWAGSDDTYDRFAETVHVHGEQATTVAALDRIGAILGVDLVEPALTPLRRYRSSSVDVLRRIGARAEPARQLARHAAGSRNLLDGAAGLLADRLDLSLAARPAAVVTYAASGRTPAVARMLRRRVGTFARTSVDAPCPLVPGQTLDLSLASTLDAHGAMGWGRPEPRGSTTKGGEARLVLPLDPSFGDADVVVTIELEARGSDAPIAIRANETVVDAATIPVAGTTRRFSVPHEVVARFAPLELALRHGRGRTPRPTSVRLRVRRLTLERDEGVPVAGAVASR